jgi:peptidoglycan/xylan/chitin deacetylase (PgdA/CDA1 family)
MSNPRIEYQFSTARPRLEPPGGRPIVVNFVVNVEHWRIEDPMPRTLLTPPHGKETVPDVPNFGWVDYGMRCGLPRMLALFTERRLPVSVSFNAGVIDAYPQAAEAILAAGWEFVGHGMHQRTLNAAADERDLIAASLDKIERFAGRRPRGWLSPGLRQTWDTLDHLKACGIEYCHDWVIEDVPVWLRTKHGPIIGMPYALEVNDSVIYAVQQQPTDEMYRRLQRTIECFEREGRRQARVLCIGLHPHLMGVPHRWGDMERMVDLLQARADVCFMSGGQIADWFATQTR